MSAAAPEPAGATPAGPAPLTGTLVDRGGTRHDAVRTADWRVDGASKVLGDAEAGFLRGRGLLTIGGRLTAADVEHEGDLVVVGPTRVSGPLRARGELRFDAAIETEELDLEGRIEIRGGAVVRHRARLVGRADVDGPLRAGEAFLAGAFRLGGPVEARTVEIELGGPCTVGPIRGESVVIRRDRQPPWRPPGTLETLRIEAREVRLEGTSVEYVRAEEIHLGPDCRVARHDGTIVERHRSAVVGPSAVSPVYPGLSR